MLDGNEVRQRREALGISQARLSEVCGLPQYALSAFELGKDNLSEDAVSTVSEVLENPQQFADVFKRRKRYQKHSYGNAERGGSRASLCNTTAENRVYVTEINQPPVPARKAVRGVSLFSGIGGLSLGFRQAGIEISGFVEIDDGLAKIYSENFPDVPRLGDDITKLELSVVHERIKQIGGVDVVVGGPPCQGFSLSGKRDIDDPRNYLFNEYIKVLDIARPKIAVVENVRLLTSMKSKSGELVKNEIVKAFERSGYKVKIIEVNAVRYGVPQHRERVFFVAVRNDVQGNPSFPEPTHGMSNDLFNAESPPRTFADACSDLAFLESGEASDDMFHTAVRHPDHVIDWLWYVPQGASAHDNADPSKRPPSGYNTTYKRQVWGEPASTVQTTFGMISGCRNVHPVATRSLTVREAARIQSFPDNYKLVGSLGTIRTGLGNAVPPLLAKKIAMHVLEKFL